MRLHHFGCVPLNIMGFGQPSQEDADHTTSVGTSKIEQYNAVDNHRKLAAFMNYLQDTLALQPVLNIAKKQAKLKIIMQRVPFSTLW